MPQNILVNNLIREIPKLLLYSLVIVITSISCKPLHVIHTNSSDVKTSTTSERDESIMKMVDPYKLQLDDAMGITLATLKEDLTKEQPESTLGNHVAEITYWSAQRNSDQQIDFAICNYGGLRVPYINKGPLKVSDAYQIMPFDNYVVIMKASGSVVLELINKMANKGGWPIHNASYIIRQGQAHNIKIQEEAFEISKDYIFAITDYLANGGDQLSFLKALDYENTNIYLRDAIMNFWKEKTSKSEIVEVVKDGRVKKME